jgi:hypothetical protein
VLKVLYGYIIIKSSEENPPTKLNQFLRIEIQDTPKLFYQKQTAGLIWKGKSMGVLKNSSNSGVKKRKTTRFPRSKSKRPFSSVPDTGSIGIGPRPLSFFILALASGSIFPTQTQPGAIKNPPPLVLPQQQREKFLCVHYILTSPTALYIF